MSVPAIGRPAHVGDDAQVGGGVCRRRGPATVKLPAVVPVRSVSMMPSPLTLARTVTSSDVLIFLTTSSTVTAAVVSMTAVLPLRSVMRNSPRRTPAPPLSCDSSGSLDSSPPPCSIVIVPAPTLGRVEVGEPAADGLLGGDEPGDLELVVADGRAVGGGGGEDVVVAAGGRGGLEGRGLLERRAGELQRRRGGWTGRCRRA